MLTRLSLLLTVFVSAPALSGQSVERLAAERALQFDGLDVAPDGQLILCGSFRGQSVLRLAPDGTGAPVVLADDLQGPTDAVVDSRGNVYVSEFLGTSIRRIAPDGSRSVFAQVPQGPAGMAIAADDTLYVTIYGVVPGTGQSIVRITPDGQVHPHVSGPELTAAVGLAIDDQGVLYVSGDRGRLYRVPEAGRLELLATLPLAGGQGFGGHLDWAAGTLFASSHIGALYAITAAGVLHTVIAEGDERSTLGAPVSPLLRGCNGLAVSADGRRLYLGCQTDAGASLVRVDLDGAPPGTRPQDAWGALQGGDPRRAEVLFRQLSEEPAAPAGVWFGLATTLYARGAHAEAASFFERAAEDPAFARDGSYNAACAHALVDQLDAAFRCLDRALQAGIDGRHPWQADNDLSALRDDPRWTALVQQHGRSG